MSAHVYRGRLAPSPTGAQHVGNARTYLIAWLRARSKNGTLLLRIEDIDSPRVKPGAADQALEDLRWLGLDWDGEPVIQTTRLHLYLQAFRQLQEQELVYPCTCTRKDVEEAASAPHEVAGNREPIYPGTCAQRRVADAAKITDKPYSWRFRAEEGDFVVWKTTNTPAYQLAVVVDDAAQQITEVVRGDDLIPSTPRQMLLYQALDLSMPQFVHVPLVVGPDGRRLAKRHGDTRLSFLRQSGVKPESLIGLLAWSCGWLEQHQPITAQELLPLFDIAKIPSKPFVFTPQLVKSL